MAFKYCFSFATDLAANFGCYRFRIMPDIVSKLLRASIWSSSAVWFELEQTPVSLTGRGFGSVALHRVLLGICCFVLMSYFYSETYEWSKKWAKLWSLLWSATTFCQFYWKFHLASNKKWFVAAWYLKSIKPLLTLELSQYGKSGSMFSSSEPVAASSDCSRLGNALCFRNAVFILRSNLWCLQ